MKVYNLMQYEHGADDVLVMGTDGLWDVLSNQEVAEAVTSFLANCDPDDLHRSGFVLFKCLGSDGDVARQQIPSKSKNVLPVHVKEVELAVQLDR